MFRSSFFFLLRLADKQCLAQKTAAQELSTVADWGGAGCWGRMINQNYASNSDDVQTSIMM